MLSSKSEFNVCVAGEVSELLVPLEEELFDPGEACDGDP